MKKDYITLLVFMLVGISIYGAYHKGYTNGKKNAVETIITQIDTVVRVDTITAIKPVYFAEKVVDSIPYYVHVTDTISVLAYLPKTEREYKDSSYYARISGYEPNLEEIRVYGKTTYIHDVKYIPKEDTRRDFVELDAKFVYDKIPLAPVTLNIGRKYGPLDVYVGGGYDFLQKAPMAQVGGRVQFKF